MKNKIKLKIKLRILLIKKKFDKWEYEDVCYMFPNAEIKARDIKRMTEKIDNIKKEIKAIKLFK